MSLKVNIYTFFSLFLYKKVTHVCASTHIYCRHQKIDKGIDNAISIKGCKSDENNRLSNQGLHHIINQLNHLSNQMESN